MPCNTAAPLVEELCDCLLYEVEVLSLSAEHLRLVAVVDMEEGQTGVMGGIAKSSSLDSGLLSVCRGGGPISAVAAALLLLGPATDVFAMAP
jgi:hypothetical protein